MLLDSSAVGQTRVDKGFTNTVDIGSGLGFGIEYRLSDRLGLEFSTLFAGLRIDNNISSSAGAVQSFDLTMMPLTLAVPFHFDVGRRADLFVGPTFSVVRYLGMETHAGFREMDTSLDIGTETTFGAALGVDVPFGKGKWAFSAGLRYMRCSAVDTDLDPVIVALGFAYRF